MGTPKPASLPEIAAARKMQQKADKPMQGPPTELQALHAKIDKLTARIADNEYAASLTAHEANRGRY